MHKNIIFDCGNVLYEWSPEQLASDFTDNEEDKKMLLDVFFKNWPLLDTGVISHEAFADMVKVYLPVHLHPTVDKILNEWYLHLPKIEETHKLVLELRKNHKVYLLSNIPTSFSNNYPKMDILNYFDGHVFSGELKLVKPDYRIYKLLLDKYDLKAEDCLFIDDSLANVTAAKKLGIDSFLFNKDKISDLVNYLRKNNDIL